MALYGFGDLIGDWSTKPNPYPDLRKISRQEAESQTDGTVISDSNERKGDGRSIYTYYRQNGLWPEEVSGFARSSIADKITPFEPIRNVPPSGAIRAINQLLPNTEVKVGPKNFPKCSGRTYSFGYDFGFFHIGRGPEDLTSRVCRDIVKGVWVVDIDPKYK